MPQYKVIAPGFANGKIYKPEGKRSVYHTDKPFTKKNPMPSWLSKMPEESAGVRNKRKAREVEQADIDAEKSEQDQKDIEDASFLGNGETGSAVETI